MLSGRAESVGVDTNDTTTPATKVSLVLGAPGLAPGTYVVAYSCETRMQSVVAGSGVEATVDIDVGAGFVEAAADNWTADANHVFLRHLTVGESRSGLAANGAIAIPTDRRSQYGGDSVEPR